MTISLTLNQTDHVIIAPRPEKKTVEKEATARHPSSMKEVRFLPYVTSYLDTTHEYNRVDRWYCARDYANFRAEINLDVERFRSVSPKTMRTLKHLMKTCIKASDEKHRTCIDDETNSDQALFQQIVVQHPRLINFLKKMIRDSPFLIGLHKYCVEYLIDDKLTRRYEIVEVVYNTPIVPMDTGSGLVTEGTCQKISCPSRLFAQVIGHVAAKAA